MYTSPNCLLCCTVHARYTCTLVSTVNVKVRVRCNQTGKVFVTSISSLEDKDCNPVTQRQVQEGLSFIWVDGGNGSGYPVTIMKILVPGGKFDGLYLY